MNPLPVHVASLRPYESARSLWKGDSWIFMDANESPLPLPVALDALPPLNRYPDPTADALREAVSAFYGLDRRNLIMANGSDELIDLLVRAFVRPGRKVVSLSPSYGMYRVSAETAGAGFVSVPLRADFSVDEDALVAALSDADLLFLCSPNNPTGTVLDGECGAADVPVRQRGAPAAGGQQQPAPGGLGLIGRLAGTFSGLICVDEAYGEFADAGRVPSSIELVRRGAENLIVLRTFSKAFAAAGIRLGYGVAGAAVIDVLLRLKPPYNVNRLTQAAGLALWNRRSLMEENVLGLLGERDRLMRQCERLGCVVFPSAANFFLWQPPGGAGGGPCGAGVPPARATGTATPPSSAARIYQELLERHRLVVRRFAGRPGLEHLLRTSTGTPEQNDIFLAALSQLLP
jgi:histidinol-phosphate aminotransferase